MAPESPRQSALTPTARPIIGVGVMVWQGDQLLLGKRTNRHGEACWQFPGGHLEAGESVLECAAREVREETGLEIVLAEHAGFTDTTFNANGRNYLTLYVSASSAGGEPRVMEPEKCQCWQWFSCDQLPAPLFTPITNFLRQVPDLAVLRIPRGTQAGEQK